MKFADWARLRPLSGICLLALLVFAPLPARAGDKALAETLFQEGRKLLEQKDFERACQKFEASQDQDPSPGTLLNLGKCNELRGKTATAWANYKEAEALARNMSRPEQQALAVERASGVEPKLSRLKIISPPKSIPGLSVKRGGVVMSAESLGVAVPVDPGEYVIEASAPGYETWKVKVAVGADADSVSTAIPDLAKSLASSGSKPSSPGTMELDSSKSSKRTIGYVVAGGGVVLLAVGGYFGLAAKKQANDAENDDNLCPDKACYPRGRDEIDSAKKKALISTIGVGAGIAALGAGIFLIATAPSRHEQGEARRARPVVRPTPLIGARSLGLSIDGAF